MREIKFRGMDANGVMRYGRLSQDKPDSTAYYAEFSQRICWAYSNIPVSNKSLGQYTGLKDKNGKEIYEGDILSYPINLNNCRCYVYFRKYRFIVKHIIKPPTAEEKILTRYNDTWEVSGNIHEHPHLLEVK